MDAIKNALKGGSGHATGTTGQPAAGQPAGQKDDIVDKIANKFDSQHGGKVGHDRLEKITDTGRGQFEKSSGTKVPSAFSN